MRKTYGTLCVRQAPAFGLVTSIKTKVYPEMNGGMHWKKIIIFPPTSGKVKEVAQIGLDMNFGDRSSSVMFLRPLPPTGKPGFAVAL